MNYEFGYVQIICENGHYRTEDCQMFDIDTWRCSCGAKAKITNDVDTTNEEEDGYKIPMPLKDSVMGQCNECGIAKVVEEETYSDFVALPEHIQELKIGDMIYVYCGGIAEVTGIYKSSITFKLQGGGEGFTMRYLEPPSWEYLDDYLINIEARNAWLQEYIKYLHGECERVATYLHVHNMGTSKEKFEEGEKIRQKLKELGVDVSEQEGK